MGHKSQRFLHFCVLLCIVPIGCMTLRDERETPVNLSDEPLPPTSRQGGGSAGSNSVAITVLKGQRVSLDWSKGPSLHFSLFAPIPEEITFEVQGGGERSSGLRHLLRTTGTKPIVTIDATSAPESPIITYHVPAGRFDLELIGNRSNTLATLQVVNVKDLTGELQFTEGKTAV